MAFLFKKFDRKGAKETQEDYTKINFEEHTSSHSWSVRKGGYEMVAKAFKKLEPQSPGWERFTSVVQTMAEEKNVPAQEKGLEALLVFVEKCETIDNQLVSAILNGIVKRGLTNAKARINELSNQICMTVIQKHRPETVVAMLTDGLDAKNPKQIFSSLSTLTSALTQFGPAIIDATNITPKVVELCSNKPYFQKDVKNYLREIYAASGTAVLSQLSSLDASQRRAMDIEFGKVDKILRKSPAHSAPGSTKSSDSPNLTKPAKPVKKPKTPNTSEPAPEEKKSPPPRPLTAKPPASNGRSVSSTSASRPKSARVSSPRTKRTPFRSPHRELYKVLNKEDSPKPLVRVFKKIDSKDWRERKEALDELLTALNSQEPIQSADFHRIVKNLRDSILDDTNVLLISKSVQCVSALARHCSGAFRQHSPLMISLLFEKFKEKKRISVDALREAADAIYHNNLFGNIIRYVLISLSHANVAVRSETELFLCRCFSRPTDSLLKPVYWQQIAGELLKNLTHPDQTVKENALKALGTLGKSVGMATLSPFLRRIPSSQMGSILRYSDEADVESRTPEPMSEASEPCQGQIEVESDESYYS